MKLPRFALRELFWLVLVVATGCAWWLERSELAARVEQLRWEIALLQLEPVAQRAIHTNRKPAP
jgi:hypothetical protein